MGVPEFQKQTTVSLNTLPNLDRRLNLRGVSHRRHTSASSHCFPDGICPLRSWFPLLAPEVMAEIAGILATLYVTFHFFPVLSTLLCLPLLPFSGSNQAFYEISRLFSPSLITKVYFIVSIDGKSTLRQLFQFLCLILEHPRPLPICH